MYTSNEIDDAIGKGISQRLSFGKGLYLRISPAGTATWTIKIKKKGRYFNYSAGHYPELSLKQAREIVEAFSQQISLRIEKAADFYTLNDAYKDWSKKQREACRSFPSMSIRIEKHLLPKLGKWQMKDLTAPDVIKVLDPLYRAGKFETIKKLCNYIKSIAIFTQNTGRAEMHDLTHIRENYYLKNSNNHMAAVSPAELPSLFYALESQPRIYGVIWAAMMTQFYTLSRPGEIALMKWEWVDFDNRVINFPAEIMKTKRPHTVPMSKQLFILLQNLPKIYEYVFVSERGAKKGQPINKESVRVMFSKAGLGGTQTAHGIRSIGSTWFALNNYPVDLSEACLSHVTESAVRRAYQRSDLLEKRRPLMQDWCDYVDRCRADAHKRINDELKERK